jgi:DNA-binding NarL/FixJ family response regulator
MQAKYHVLIADDHAILREGLCALLSAEDDLEVVGQVDNGRDALHLAASLKPELVLMDLSMPRTNGTEAIRHIKKRYPEIRIIALTVHKADEYIHAALTAGADGYLLKDDCLSELLTAIRSVLGGKLYVSPSVADKVVTGYLGPKDAPNARGSWEALTHREREVIKLVAEGYKNREIAEYLSISPKTVEKHRANLMRKLNLRSAADLTAYAIEKGLVTR